MATFDFIDSAAKGYKFLWDEKRAIVRLGFPVVLIKLVSFVLMTSSPEMQHNFLRHGLILLPTFFAEGWLLAHFIRRALYNEALPFQSRTAKKTSTTASSGRWRMIRAGTAVYVLIWLVLSFLGGLAKNHAPYEVEEIPEPSLETYLAVTVVFILLMWLFRLFWLYIPVTMGYSIPAFMHKARGYITSVYMAGTWVICYTPLFLVLMLVSDIALYLFPLESGQLPETYQFVMTAAGIVFNFLAMTAATIAIAHGVQTMMNEDKTNK